MNALNPPPQFATLPRSTRSRLTHTRLRQPTPLPANRSAMRFYLYLDRLLWMFGARGR